MFDVVVGVVEKTGYVGVFLLMLAENLFPPFPSEIIMPLAGFTAARGDLHAAGVVVAGTAGSLCGAAFWYFVGARLGMERLVRWTRRHGRWLGVSADEIEQAGEWFGRHCASAVFLGRLLPSIRTLISVPAGVTRMPLTRFFAYSAMGTVLWTGALAAAGYLLEDQYQRVASYIAPVSNGVLILIVATYLYRVATFKRRSAE